MTPHIEASDPHNSDYVLYLDGCMYYRQNVFLTEYRSNCYIYTKDVCRSITPDITKNHKSFILIDPKTTFIYAMCKSVIGGVIGDHYREVSRINHIDIKAYSEFKTKLLLLNLPVIEGTNG